VTTSPDPENRLICPNCHALNAPLASVCTSCGVNIDDFRTALPRLQQIRINNKASQLEILNDEKTLQIQDEVTSGHKAFQKLLLVLFFAILITGLMVSGGAVLYANLIKQEQEKINISYQKSLVCLQAQKFLCARDGFKSLLTLNTRLPNIMEYLNQAQFGLALQYFDSGQWEMSVIEFNDLLQRDPGNQKAIDLLKEAYDRWVDQLRLEGKWFQKWLVQRERDARFPPIKSK
jgi:tetratricopeptide (TPR) repeat protein